MLGGAEDVQGLEPCLRCLPRLPHYLPYVADLDECVRLKAVVTQRTVPLESLLVAADRQRVVAQLVVGVAKTVPGVPNAVSFAEFFLQGKRPLAANDRCPVTT